MPVEFLNYEYKYKKKGKPVFAPNERGRRIGKDIKRQVDRAVKFDPFFYHLREGGHVAALHAHRDHRYFAKLDIERYFYSIARNRVQRALVDSGILRARHYAKWSCVRNPYGEPRYCLPYGFVQSPVLATLVLMLSGVGGHLRGLGPAVAASVYMDDISLSSDNLDELQAAFEATLLHLEQSGFEVNRGKVREPAPAMDLFNCDLSQGQTVVQEARVDEFHAEGRSPDSEEAFVRYCDSIEVGNVPPS